MSPVHKRQQRWKAILTAVTFLAFAVLIYALREQIFTTISRLSDINAIVLLLMLVTQALNYNSYTNMYQGIFAILGHIVPYRKMLRVLTELNFVNNIFPSGGVSGFSYMGVRMRSLGISSAQATLAQAMRFVLIFISFEAMLFIGLFLLALGGQASNLMILVAGSLATLLVVLTLTIGFVIGSERRINSFATFVTRLINSLIRIVRPKHHETIPLERVRKMLGEFHENYMVLKTNYRSLKRPLLFAFLANLAEIMTIYVVYIAFGEWVNPGAVIIAYAIANFAGLISVLPGGIGIYEALMTGVLAAAGVPPAVSIPVTVMYRVINMSIQLPIGSILYYRNLHRHPSQKL